MSLQDKAVDLVLERSEQEAQETYIGGVAGSGKTFTLVRAFNELRNQNLSPVVLAPTNKAAHVMRSRGIPAGTIHSFMYTVEERELLDDKGQYIYDSKGKVKTELIWHHRLDSEKSQPDIPRDILVDECSMVGGRLYHDLLRYKNSEGTNFTFFGDAFQLPPVKDETIFQVRKPDVFLDEVHRVAQGNPVLAYATFVRTHSAEDSYPKWQDFPRASMFSPTAKDMFCEEGAQVICWTNNTRRKINQIVRERRGLTDVFPVAGERLIILNNTPSKKLYNGTFVVVQEIEDKGDFLEAYVTVEDEENDAVKITMNKAIFHPDGMYKTGKGNIQADYAYCITAHKSQGSEWPLVVVVDQRKWMKDEGMKQHWFYTAITRTRDRLQIVK